MPTLDNKIRKLKSNIMFLSTSSTFLVLLSIFVSSSIFVFNHSVYADNSSDTQIEMNVDPVINISASPCQAMILINNLVLSFF